MTLEQVWLAMLAVPVGAPLRIAHLMCEVHPDLKRIDIADSAFSAGSECMYLSTKVTSRTFRHVRECGVEEGLAAMRHALDSHGKV